MAKKKTTTEQPDVVENEIPTIEEQAEVITEAKKDETDWQDKYLRLMAEFDNYKKRTQREKEKLYNDAMADAFEKMLPVLDTFQRALATEVTTDEAKGVYDGVVAINKQFEEIMTQAGVKKIEAVGNEFDPLLHNAVMHIEDENVGTNIVVEEFAAGYTLGDRVIRHSMVKVAN
ncbi:MAG: nucleotide exchange factor GrpE [Eubacteriales bacterium]|nr:nucleotide exchange factor GrpE [Eubacteriales bacterium]